MFPWEKTIKEIENEVMQHFSYHHMYDLCDHEKFRAAVDKLRAKKIKPTFYQITGLMKEMG